MDIWKKPGPRRLWTHEAVAEEAKKYSRKKDFRDHSSGAYRYATQNGIVDDICQHMKNDREWTMEALTEEAKKYSLIREFRRLSPYAFSVCCKKKILSSVCEHMADFSQENINRYKIRPLSNVDKATLRDTKKERENLGLRPLEVKIRVCISCKIYFESIGDRTCGCTKDKSTVLAGIEVI